MLVVVSQVTTISTEQSTIWFAINKLSLNLAKTNFMVFSNHTKTSNITVCINDTTIEMVYVNTFLGVLIDHKLKWKQHNKMITSKLSKTCVSSGHSYIRKLLQVNGVY